MKTEAGIAEDLSSFVIVVVVTKKGITLTCWSRAGGPGLRVWGPAAGDVILKGGGGAAGRGFRPVQALYCGWRAAHEPH